MTRNRSAIAAAWREIETATAAADLLMKHADCNGPLADLPTADTAVRLVMNARRHLLRKAAHLRTEVLSNG